MSTSTAKPDGENEAAAAEWNEMAPQWDNLAAGYRDSLVQLLWKNLPAYSTVKSNLVVVDFGCGTGLLTEVLQQEVKHVYCFDAAPKMIARLLEKKNANPQNWSNVEAYTANFSSLSLSTEVQEILSRLEGTVDLVVASSVLGFIPDTHPTMQVLSKLLKPKSGLLVHSDWPKSDENETGFTPEKAQVLYAEGGLIQKSMQVVSISMGANEEKAQVFLGIASKP